MFGGDKEDDGCLLDFSVCGSCQNEFWVESYEVDLAINEPVCCPFCCTMFETFLEAIDEDINDEEG